MSIVALAGYWIMMFQLVKTRGNVLPDLSLYPLRTVALMM
jgi:hypothetical protein